MHDALAVAAINPGEVDWGRVRLSQYLVHQVFTYEYPGRIHDLRHRLMVIPPVAFGTQQRTTYSLKVSEPAEVITSLDSFANPVLDVHVSTADRSLRFDAWMTVERSGPPGPRELPAAWLRDPRFLTHTARTAPDPAIERAADEIRGAGLEGLELAEFVSAWVHERMTYVGGVTGIHTTAAEVLAEGIGVCQDYSHLMISICRLLGLPALYISGHQLGEGSTHAWVEVLLPAADGSDHAEGWALDPTHGTRGDLTYLTVAAGRDYGDVAPTSGSYRGGLGGTLLGRQEVFVTEVEYAD